MATQRSGPCRPRPRFAAFPTKSAHAGSRKASRKNSNLSLNISENVFNGPVLSYGSVAKAQTETVTAEHFPSSLPVQGDVYLHRKCVCLGRADGGTGSGKVGKWIPGGRAPACPPPAALGAGDVEPAPSHLCPHTRNQTAPNGSGPPLSGRKAAAHSPSYFPLSRRRSAILQV